MRRLAPVIVGVVAVGAAAYGGYAFASADRVSTPTTVATETAEVVRTDLVQTETLDGTLGYGSTVTMASGLSGTVTGLPPEGAILEPGDVVHEIDGQPVVLLVGDRPAWRTIDADTEDGADIAQLEVALSRIGFGPDDWEPDDVVDADTTQAIESFRSEYGLDDADELELGRVVFLPEAVRVGAHLAQIGDLVQPGSALFRHTEPFQVVSMELEPDRLDLVAEGDVVTVTLPDSREVGGRVVEVGQVVVPAGPEPEAPGVIEVTIALDEDVEGLDQAPVEVDVESDRASGVLAVPVRALLALSDGGYAVEIDGRLIGVEVGDFAAGLVEVTGALEEGDRVVIPR